MSLGLIALFHLLALLRGSRACAFHGGLRLALPVVLKTRRRVAQRTIPLPKAAVDGGALHNPAESRHPFRQAQAP